MLGWSRLLVLVAIDGAVFLLSGLTAHSARHSGTLSNVLWMDFLLGVVLVAVLALVNLGRRLRPRRRDAA